jgi:hypothetical protein
MRISRIFGNALLTLLSTCAFGGSSTIKVSQSAPLDWELIDAAGTQQPTFFAGPFEPPYDGSTPGLYVASLSRPACQTNYDCWSAPDTSVPDFRAQAGAEALALALIGAALFAAMRRQQD